MLEFGVLGYLRVQADDLDIDIPGERRTAVLVRLLMAGGHPLSTAQLAEDAWDGSPPKAAVATLQSHVSFLRKTIPSLAIRYVSGGYVLDRNDATLDSALFEEDVADAQAHRSNLERTEALLRRALGRWRGPALADVAGASWALGETARLEQLRIGALESWLHALVETGRSAEAVAEAEAAVEAAPFSDGLWSLLMMALYRSGRQGEALRAYQKVRDFLAESGLEPSAKLTALEEAIARDDPELSPMATTGPALLITGDRELDGMGEPESSRQSSDLPEIKTNLPSEISSFVGREAELSQVGDLLSIARLVTITGAGGLGKTRLALQTAAELRPQFEGGAWFIDLAPLSDPSHVPSAVSRALRVREEPDSPIVDTLVGALRTRKALLIFDNCEHVVESTAQLVEALIRACPELHVLASSRERLDVRGERIFRIPPLTLPEPSGGDSIGNSEAVLLFVQRASENSMGFELTSGNAEVVASICGQLDGLPLAIELAAARLRTFSVFDIETRLSDRFGLLTGGSRTAAARQRTLSATVQWSYDLLNEEERWMLGRLSVFRGGWDVETAESLCAAPPDIPALDVIDVLSSLVDKSLIYTEGTSNEGIRYRVLETIREYAAARLAAESPSEVEATGVAHARTFLTMVQAAAPHLSGRNQSEWLARLELEHENLRAALAFCQRRDAMSDESIELATGLRPFWEMKGYYQEAGAFLEDALQGECLREPSLSRARVLVASGSLNRSQPDVAKARLDEARTLALEFGDAQLLGEALCELAWIEFNADNSDNAIALATDGLAAAEKSADLNLIGFALAIRGSLMFPMDQSAGRADFGQAIERFTATDNSERVSSTLCRWAIHELEQGDRQAAKRHLDTVLEISSRLGNDGLLPFVWAALGHCAMLDGDPPLARTRFEQCLTNALRVDDRRVIAYAVFGLAYSAAGTGHRDAAKLYGIADRLLEEYGEKLEPSEERQRAEDRALLVNSLGETPFEQAHREGSLLKPGEAIAFVRQHAQA